MLPGRPGGALPGPGFPDRAVRRLLSASPHGAAPVVHDGRAAALWLGIRSSRCSAACRGPSAPTGLFRCFADRRLVSRLFAWLTHPVVALPFSSASPGSGTSRRSMNWPCVHAAGTASSTSASWARGCCSGIPWSGRTQPAALVALAAFSLPDPGRRPEHRPVGPADVLRPRAVSVLSPRSRESAACQPSGSVGGGRHHVGARLVGLSCATVRDRRSAAGRRRARDVAENRRVARPSSSGARFSVPAPLACSPSPPTPLPQGERERDSRRRGERDSKRVLLTFSLSPCGRGVGGEGASSDRPRSRTVS